MSKKRLYPPFTCFLLVAACLGPIPAGFATTPSEPEQDLQRFTGEYRLVRAEAGQGWEGDEQVHCMSGGTRITVSRSEETGLTLRLLPLEGRSDFDSRHHRFGAINERRSGGSVWEGARRITASYHCALARDGKLRKRQRMSQHALGLVPQGSSVGTTTLEERDGILIYRYEIDQEQVAECVYEKL